MGSEADKTFSEHDFFRLGNPGNKRLKQVIRAYLCHQQKITYVQGMNYIVA